MEHHSFYQFIQDILPIGIAVILGIVAPLAYYFLRGNNDGDSVEEDDNKQ